MLLMFRKMLHVAFSNACNKQLKLAMLSDGAAFITDHRAILH